MYRLYLVLLFIFILHININCGLDVNNKNLEPPVDSVSYNDNSDFQTIDLKVKLAKHLSQKGVRMYGAYWCPYCDKQKELFDNVYIKQN